MPGDSKVFQECESWSLQSGGFNRAQCRATQAAAASGMWSAAGCMERFAWLP